MECDLFIKNACLLPLANGDSKLITPGFVAVKDGVITGLGPMSEVIDPPIAGEVIDAKGLLAMPGLVNGHCHGAMTLFRGLADDLPLMTWLQDHIFPAEAKFVAPEMVYWCSKLAAGEMLLSGTTTVADGYFHEHDAARAFRAAGLRAVVAQGVIDFPAPGVPDPTKNVAEAEAFLLEWQGKDNRIMPAVFCHSPYTCGADTLQKTKELARRKDVSFFIHVAETKIEVEQCRRQHGLTPIRYLHKLGVLDQSTVLIHCVWLEPEEVAMLAASSATVVTCPESNMKLASGIAPLRELLEAEVVVGMGTDGCASNNDLDLFGEMDLGAKLHKVKDLDPTALAADQVLRMVTLDGARVLGMKDAVGSLAKGKRADIILLDLAKPHLTPFYSADLLVYAARGSDVRTVIIDGEIVVRDRCILSFDPAEAMERVTELAEKVKKGI